jgi:predicted enzyme related to lactoylglutathione lyase
MTQHNGRFVWYDLMSPDAGASMAFYCDVVGWTASEAGPMHPGYSLLHAPSGMAGGVNQSAGKRLGWHGYVAVGDLEAKAAQAADLGGQVLMPPQDIPDVGRFALVADPQGAVLVLFRPNMLGDSIPDPMLPGRVGWNELLVADWESAFPFYEAMFGWTKGNPIDMGPMGIYQLFAAGGTVIGGMMSMPSAPPAWRYYFSVPALDAALARVVAAGGQVTNGPMEVPGGAWVLNGTDPFGTSFALVAPGR